MGFAGISWYASPDGGWRGNGSRERPWSLERALSHPDSVQPGDVIFLLGGLYRPRSPLVSRLRGTAEAPIELRGDPESEAVRIDTVATGASFGLRVADLHARFAGFELFNSTPARWSDLEGAEGDPRGIGVLCQGGAGTELVDLIVHDFGTSVFESQAGGLKIHGCLFFNSYWDAPDRSHGPGLYIRNPSGAPRKNIENNIVFQHGRQGLQGFGSIPFANVGVEGNVFFNNGIAGDGFHRNVMFGNETADHDDLAIRNNVMYFAPGGYRGHEHNLLGGDGGSRELQFTGNWVIHEGREALRVQRAESPVIEGNQVFGGLYYSSPDGSEELRNSEFEQRFPDNGYYDEAPAGETWIWRRRHSDLPDRWQGLVRITVCILNWSAASSIGVCLQVEASAEELDGVQTVRVRSAQDPAVVRELPMTDGAVSIPLDGWSVAWPIGRDPEKPLPRTLPEFGAFLVEWPHPGWAAERRKPAPLSDPGAGLPAEAARQARIAAWAETGVEGLATLREERRRAWREAARSQQLQGGLLTQLIFSSAAQAEAFRSAVEIVPAIEGGMGSAQLGRAAVQPDGTARFSHRFREVDLDWIRAVAGDMELTIEPLAGA